MQGSGAAVVAPERVFEPGGRAAEGGHRMAASRIAEPGVGGIAGQGAEGVRKRAVENPAMCRVSSLRVRALDRRTGGESLLAPGWLTHARAFQRPCGGLP